MRQRLSSDHTTTAGSCRWDPLLLPLLMFAVYLAMEQSSVHHADSHFLITMVRKGVTEHPWHMWVLYPPVWIGRALAHVGVEAVASLRLTMALSAALGVAFLHRAALTYGGDPRLARWATLGAALTPGWFYFATMIELQALEMPGVGLATWMYARLAVRPSPMRAVLAGVASALATAMHSDGHMIPVLFVILGASGWRHWRGVRSGVAAAALVGGAHTVAYLGIAAVMGGHGQNVEANSAGLLLAGLSHHDVVRFLRVILEEWLLAFLPFSVFAPLLAWRGGRLRELGGLLLCTGMLLVVTFLIIGDEPGSWEFGAYLLPLVLPTAWLAVRHATPALARLLVAVALVSSVVALALHARSFPVSAAFAHGAEQQAQKRPMVLLCETRFDRDSLYLFAPEVPMVDLDTASSRHMPADEGYRVAQQLLELSFGGAAAEGRLIVFPERTWEELGRTGDGIWDRLVREYIPQHFQLERIGAGDFAGMAVTGRR